jgi:serine/threonine protein kinase
MKKQVKNYLLEQVLGEGQFGLVYHSKDVQTKQQFAVKMVSLNLFKQKPDL